MQATLRLAVACAACAGVALALASTPVAAQMFAARYDKLRFPDASTQLTEGQIDQLLAAPAAVRRVRMNGVLAERADDLAAHALRGVSEVELDDGAAAIDDLAPVDASTVPDTFTRSFLLQFRAEAMLEARRAPEALVAADAAVALAPTVPFARATRGWARYANGELAGAAEDLRGYLAKEPNDGLAHYRLGQVLDAQHDYAGAVGELALALGDRDRDNPGVRMSLAHARMHAGQFDGAATLYRAALSAPRASPYVPARLYVARLRADVGAEPAARTELAQVAPPHTPRQWIDDIDDFLLGRLDAPALRRLADAAPPDQRAGRQCETDYYVAEVRLAHGRAVSARPLLDEAATLCPSTFVEAAGTQAELHAPAAPATH